MDLPGVRGHTAEARDAIGEGQGQGRKGLILSGGGGKRWHSAAQGTPTLSRAVTRLTRLISSSLFSCRALSKPNAFPPAGDKESAGKQGYLPDHAPPSEFPRVLRPAHRWRPRDVRRGTLQGHQALTLEPVAECDRHGMSPTPDKTKDNREEKASGPDLRRRVATGPRGGGTSRLDTPRPACRPPPAPLPAAARTRGIKARCLAELLARRRPSAGGRRKCKMGTPSFPVTRRDNITPH